MIKTTVGETGKGRGQNETTQVLTGRLHEGKLIITDDWCLFRAAHCKPPSTRETRSKATRASPFLGKGISRSNNKRPSLRIGRLHPSMALSMENRIVGSENSDPKCTNKNRLNPSAAKRFGPLPANGRRYRDESGRDQGSSGYHQNGASSTISGRLPRRSCVCRAVVCARGTLGVDPVGRRGGEGGLEAESNAA